MTEYRRPFLQPEHRRPTLTWPRQIPIGGEPRDVHEIVEAYSKWLQASSSVPKLFINADPGIVLIGPQREFARVRQAYLDKCDVFAAQFDRVHDSAKSLDIALLLQALQADLARTLGYTDAPGKIRYGQAAFYAEHCQNLFVESV